MQLIVFLAINDTIAIYKSF